MLFGRTWWNLLNFKLLLQSKVTKKLNSCIGCAVEQPNIVVVNGLPLQYVSKHDVVV